MGETTDQAMKDIDATRRRIDLRIDQVSAALPNRKALAIAAAGIGGSAVPFVLWRRWRQGRARRAEASLLALRAGILARPSSPLHPWRSS